MAGTKSEAKGKKNKVVGGVKKETGRLMADVRPG